MKSIFEFTQNVCTFTLIITLLMNIFPHSYNKKYVKLFAGILLICLILNPIINWKNSKFDIEEIISEYAHGQYQIEFDNEIAELESKMEERLKENTDGY